MNINYSSSYTYVLIALLVVLFLYAMMTFLYLKGLKKQLESNLDEEKAKEIFDSTKHKVATWGTLALLLIVLAAIAFVGFKKYQSAQANVGVSKFEDFKKMTGGGTFGPPPLSEASH